MRKLLALSLVVGLLAGCTDDDNSPPPPAAPSIVTHPVGGKASDGASVTLTVAASGTAPLTYQWQRNGFNINNETSASYTISSVTAADSGAQFRCVVSNALGNATSDAAAITLIIAPANTLNIEDSNATAEAVIPLICNTNATTPSYQWTFDDVDILGATSSTYTAPANTPGTYTCIVSDAVDFGTDPIRESAPTTISIVATPTSSIVEGGGTVSPGTPVTFTSSVTVSGTASYQWNNSAGPITGATSSTYTVPADTPTSTYTCTVTDDNVDLGATSVTSAGVTLTFVDLDISIAEESGNVPPATAVTLTTTETVAGTVTYQWANTSGDILDATSSSYTIPADTATDTYTCTIIDDGIDYGTNTATSASVTVTLLPAAPTVSIVQASGGVAPDTQVNLSTNVTVNGTASYQWANTSGDIDGATSNSYTVPEDAPTDTYTCTVTDDGIDFGTDTATSVGVTLTLFEPTVSIVEEDGIVAPSTAVDLTTTVNVLGTATYQWRNISGNIIAATSSTYTVPADTATNTYTCTVTDDGILYGTNTATSEDVALTLVAVPTSILDIADSTATAEATILLTCTTDAITPSYVWTLDGTPISGETLSTYTIPANTPGVYTCTVTDTVDYGTNPSTESATTTITIGVAPTISIVEQGGTVAPGTPVTLTTTETVTGTATYQWSNANGDIALATANTYTVPADTNTNLYMCTITDDALDIGTTSVTSSSILLTLLAPAISINESDGSVAAATSVTLTTTDNITDTATYQWANTSGDILGATSNSYTIPADTATDTYTCTVTDDVADYGTPTATSAGVVLTLAAAPTISIVEGGGNVTPGTPVTLTTTVSVSGTATYQWANTSADIDGATSSTYTVPADTATDTYTCTVTDVLDHGTNTATSAGVTLTLLTTAPTVSITTATGTVADGYNLDITTTTTDVLGTASYEWKRGTTVVGGNTATLNIASFTTTDTGDYTCTITDSGIAYGDTAVSASVTFTRVAAPTVNITTTTGSVAEGYNMDIASSTSGVIGTASYEWKRGTTVVGGNTTTLNIASFTTTDADNYTCTITDSGITYCSVTSAPVAFTYVAAPVITAHPIAPPSDLVEGEALALAVTATGTNLSYQWIRDVTTLVDSPSTIGTTTNALGINPVAVSDTGNYTCVVTATATYGSVPTTSNAADVTVLLAPPHITF